MIYKISSKGEAPRAASYRGTIKNKGDAGLADLKARIDSHNISVRKARERGHWWGSQNTYRIALMARGPRRKNGVRVHPGADQSLRHEYATHFDVYVHSNHDGIYYTQLV